MEVWKDVVGHEGKYQVSSLGRVKSLPRQITYPNGRSKTLCSRKIEGQFLRPGRSLKSGYLSVTLGHKANGRYIHQLVAETFLGPRPQGLLIRHLNGDPSDNRVENLAYGTNSQNQIDVYAHKGRLCKLSIADVKSIRRRLILGESCKNIAETHKIRPQTVSSIKHRRSYAWLK